MITKMKKVMLFIPDINQDVDEDLTRLGQLGVMHIAPFQPAQDESIDRVNARIKQMQTAMGVLESVGVAEASELENDVDFSSMERGEIVLMEEILNADNRRKQQEELLKAQQDSLLWYSKWGKVTEKERELLSDAGLTFHLYLLDNKEYKLVSGRPDVYRVGMIDEKIQVVQISDNPEARLDFIEITYPPFGVIGLEEEIEKTRTKLEDTREKLRSLQAQKHILHDALEERIRRYDVRNIQYEGVVLEEHIRCWKGFLPEDAVDLFVAEADKHSWGYMIEDPSQEDEEEVPTLIQAPRWAQRIRPVMNFMGLVPGYKEIDVSKIFMLFFVFFTGILVGDAGYGLIFLLATLFIHSRRKFKRKIEFELIYTLSISILLWGVLTGTYFGSHVIAEIPFFSRLRINALASFGGNSIVTQNVMFLIGAVHISIGHLQIAWRYSNSVRAIAQFGWVAITWGLYLIVCQMVLGIEAPGFMLWLFVGGAVLVALFSTPGKSFFKGVFSSLGSLPLSIINGFSDIISYIRLYAVGLATVLMASSFNEMAIGEGVTTVASAIGAIIILILGHGLNMILAGMAVIVHGVRLNMLEYSGHADVEYSGTEYNPFKIKQKDKSKSQKT